MAKVSLTVLQKLDIAEAIFRYQFLLYQEQKAPAYFLSVFRKDPDHDFLKRFDGHKPPVQKGSEFAQGKGLAFEVRNIKSVSKTKVEVSGGYYEDGDSSADSVYLVEFIDGKWVVTNERWVRVS